jgi:tetratricopeptide (TPR) repeat protein
MTTQQMEQALSSEADTYLRGITIAENRRYLEQKSIQQQIRPTGEKAVELDKSISATQKPWTEPLELLPELKTQTFQEQPPQSRAKSDYEQMDVYERMKLQFDRLKKGVIELPAEKQAEAAADAQRESVIRQVESDQAGKTDGSVAEQPTGVSDVDINVAKAAQIKGPHRTFASFAKDRFNQSMRSAEEYLKRGKYYRAADAYTLALIYKSNDPLAYAGKSHALFAAGEYMSSGLFLLRALEIFPEYAAVKVDLEYMLGDRDKIDNRIVDIERWYQKSGAVELKFLLAYVYYQMDRFEQAGYAIDAVYESMPDAPAVAALKDAIYDAVKSNER